MAYKTDGTANFNFFINRQGPRGPQGIEGEQGFSPSITEGENTAETYTLQVNNKDGSFTTPNLKPQFQDRGGDVVKVDREHDTLYFGTVSIPDAVDLTTDQTVGGNKTFSGNSTFAGTSNFTNNVNITGANLEVSGVLDASSATITNLQVSNSLTSSGVINAVGINAASIKNNQNNRYYLDQSKIVAGSNIAIEETTDGVKISSTDTKYTLPAASSTTLGGIKVGDNLSITEDGTLSAINGSSEPPANMVTTDTEQTITGSKTFTSDLIIDANQPQSIAKLILSDGNSAQGAIGTNRTYGGVKLFGRTSPSSSFQSMAEITPNSATFNGFLYIGDKIAYHKGNLVAGTNVEFNTVNGVTSINSTGPTNEQIGQILESLADLSTKINNLTDRVRDLETQIDGGVAGSIYAPEPQKLQEQVVEGLSIKK